MAKTNGRHAPLNALRAFEAAARHLSFKKAAVELHVTAGAVSHQVKQLEEFLGVQLFRRLTRALELTAEAHAMLPGLREGFASLAAAVDSVRQREASTSFTVMTPPGFAKRWLVPRLAGFTQAHPLLEIHVSSRNEMIDGREPDLALAVGDPRDDAPLVQVRFGTGHYSGLQVEPVFSATYVAVCSPRLTQGRKALRTPADLANHTLLHDDTEVEEGARPLWQDFLAMAGVDGVEAERGPHFSDASLAIDAAIEGLGVALAMKPLVSADIASGRLVIPFPVEAPTRYAYYLVMPANAVENAGVASFREWLLAASAEERR
jgi:LysR family glycine cleavage system transcriptional activator